MMSSPGLSGESSSSSTFHSLWTQLRECHHSDLQELQDKVSRLKKQRCSDAEVVERTLKQNRVLMEQNKALQETAAAAEERLRVGRCDHCSVTEEHLRTKQAEFEEAREQSLRLIAELTEDRNSLGEENRKLNVELSRLKVASWDPQPSCGEQEEGVIPDSPLKHISGPLKHRSGPVISKKRRREGGTEPHIPELLSQTQSSILTGLSKGLSFLPSRSPKKDVLVPETCEMDAFLAPRGPEGAVVAETCCLDAPGSPVDNFLPAKGLLQTESLQTCQRTLGSGSGSGSTHARHGDRTRTEGDRTRTEGDRTRTEGDRTRTEGDRTRTEGTFLPRSSSPVFGKSLLTSVQPVFPEDKSILTSVQPVSPEDKSLLTSVQPISPEDKSLLTSVQPISPEDKSLLTSVQSVSPEVKSLLTSVQPVSPEDKSLLTSVQSVTPEDKNLVASVQPVSPEDKTLVTSSQLFSPEDMSPSVLRTTKLSRTAKQRQRIKQMGIPRIAPLRPGTRGEQEREKRREDGEEGSGCGPLDCSYAHRDPQKALVSQTDSRVAGPRKQPSTTPTSHQTSTQNSANPEQHDFKKPIRKSSWGGCKDLKQTSVLPPGPCARPLLDHGNAAPRTATPDPGRLSPVEPVWSMDPGLALSQPDSHTSRTTQPGERGETVDLDCTFVSHSLLLRGLHQSVPGIGQKANDSLAEIFDQTTFGEYASDVDQQDLDDDDEEEGGVNEEEEEGGEDEEEAEGGEGDAPKSPNQPVMNHGNHQDIPSFAHVAVVRKREERRKLKGHTCKECEIYYADLPEAERLKKLSACSRHRFRHIPPATPEHFWEVGFPSTQTCVERGYIREDKEPERRIRRRRPYNAIFTPKAKEQKTSLI